MGGPRASSTSTSSLPAAGLASDMSNIPPITIAAELQPAQGEQQGQGPPRRLGPFVFCATQCPCEAGCLEWHAVVPHTLYILSCMSAELHVELHAELYAELHVELHAELHAVQQCIRLRPTSTSSCFTDSFCHRSQYTTPCMAPPGTHARRSSSKRSCDLSPTMLPDISDRLKTC